MTGNQISLVNNNLIRANITTTTLITGSPITNYTFEIEENETKRRIRIIKPQVISEIINEFESTINR